MTIVMIIIVVWQRLCVFKHLETTQPLENKT
jgi:hypothetical protein